MKTVIISPFSKLMRDCKVNPKNYPISYWKEIIRVLKNNSVRIIQIGTSGEEDLGCDLFLNNLALSEVKKEVIKADICISVDNFLPHMINSFDKNRCSIVIFGKSDPRIFGYDQNINILKDVKYLRQKQFDMWESEEFDEDVFVSPEIVLNELKIKGIF